MRSVVKILGKEKRQSEEYKVPQTIDLPCIPYLFLLVKLIENCEETSCIPIEIVNQIFASDIVSVVKMSHLEDIEDKRSYFIGFCTRNKSEIKDKLKNFSRKTSISLEKLKIVQDENLLGIWLRGKNLGIFLYAVEKIIDKFNKILSSSLFSGVQSDVLLDIISAYCSFNHKISKKEISKYLNSSDLFKANLKNAFNDSAGLGLEETHSVNALTF